MNATRRAVITGLGVLTPIGCDPAAFWSSLRAGTPGVRGIRSLDASALPCRIAGEIPDFDAKKLVGKEMRKSLKVMARTVQMGLAAATQVMDAGGPKAGAIDPYRFGIEFGCLMVATELEDLTGAAKETITATPRAIDMATWGTRGQEAVPPLWMLKYLPNMPACHTSIAFNAQGPNNTITEGDAAGLLAVGEAYRILGRGLADYFLVGGCDSKINPLSLTRHNSFLPLTRRNDAPETAVRPFDRDRDGTALGEAACVFGLEELTFARARGATILGEVAGFAAGFDRNKTGTILARVIQNALREANITPADVDHVNAQAAGIDDDAFEAKAIREALGDVPVWSIKGQIGNTGAASGAVELAASLLALAHGETPATVNFSTAAADCPVNVTRILRPTARPYAVKISHTDMGQCGVVVLRKWEGI